MGKHLKKLRSEKAKIKLKTKLPKGQNVTDTSFKVKKIQITEQLPDHAGVPVTSKHQTLQDCLNYLNHHNVSKQLDGLRGLKEIYDGNVRMEKGLQLRKIITKVLETAVEDMESKVRRSAIKLLSEVFSSLPLETRSPYMDLLNKQVQRALSNINPGVQKDALRLVDLLMTITDSADLSARKPLLTLLLRLLTITGDSAPPRSAVLLRLLTVVEAVFPLTAKSVTDYKEISWNDRPGRLTSTYKEMPVISLTSSPILSTVDSSPADNKHLIDRLVRTGVGVWTEMSPDDHTSDQVAELLSLLARLVLRLFKYSSSDSKELKSWFNDSFRELIGRNLLSRFPYQAAEETTTKSRQADFTEENKKPSTDLVETNVNLAVIYLHLQPKQDLLPKILRFLPDLLKQRPVLACLEDLLDALLKILNVQSRVVAEVAESCRQHSDPILTSWLHRVALDETYSQCLSLPQYQEWIRHLVHTGKHSEILAIIAGRGTDPELMKTLQEAMPRLLKNPDIDRNMINALYWACPREQLLMAADGINPATKKYLTQISYMVS